jgi:Arc/MetJ family transcription regulator
MSGSFRRRLELESLISARSRPLADMFPVKDGDRQEFVPWLYIYTAPTLIYTRAVAKHLIDIDEAALREARAELGSKTIKETVNSALRQAGDQHRRSVKRRLDLLAGVDLEAREQAWR